MTGDRITYVGSRPQKALEVIDGAGLVLAPGFLDVNSGGIGAARAGFGRLKLLDGVTAYLSAQRSEYSDSEQFPSTRDQSSDA